VDESTAEFRARQLVAAIKPAFVPVSVEAYAAHIGAVIRPQRDLGPDEPGWSFENNGKRFICVNANDLPERQRFTVCHELAHIVLRLPSEHQEAPSWSHVKRSANEICCDIFAAELLLPAALVQPLVARAEIGFPSIDELASRAQASFSTTGSRFAALAKAPCAFVFSDAGAVRYASRSTALREAKGWIAPRTPLPRGSISERVRAGESCDRAEEIAADMWLADWKRGGDLLEQARHLAKWDQTLTLLWFEDEEAPAPRPASREEEDESGLKELDGQLSWPGKKRRR
jgi:hypothetical protein